MSTYNKNNELIDPKTEKPLATKKHSNIPAYLIAGVIGAMLLVAGVFYASEKLSDYIEDNFIVVVNLN